MIRVAVEAAPDRARLELRGGSLSPRLLFADASGARVALVATEALLLGGDHVDIEIEVGLGAWLEIVEIAGTVAYDSAGVPSGWTARMWVATGGVLLWGGQPFVVASGAQVDRLVRIDLAAGSTVCLRETIVLGRVRERGGALRSRTNITLAGKPLLVEDLDLTDADHRELPGILATARVLDTVSILGRRGPERPVLDAGHRFELAGSGTVARDQRREVAGSPAGTWWTAWREWALREWALDKQAPDEQAPDKQGQG